jgi:recombinational DNA repair protein RecT
VEAAIRLERHLEEMATKMASKETMSHLVGAGMEVVQAANAAVSQLDVPEETKVRIHKAEREVLLAMKGMIDAVLTEIDKELPKDDRELKKVPIKRKSK